MNSNKTTWRLFIVTCSVRFPKIRKPSSCFYLQQVNVCFKFHESSDKLPCSGDGRQWWTGACSVAFLSTGFSEQVDLLVEGRYLMQIHKCLLSVPIPPCPPPGGNVYQLYNHFYLTEMSAALTVHQAPRATLAPTHFTPHQAGSAGLSHLLLQRRTLGHGDIS